MARDVIDSVLGPADAKARPSDTAELAARRRRRRRCPGPDRRRARRRSRRCRDSARRWRPGSSPGTARRRPASSRSGAELGLLRPLVAGPAVPRGRGRLGGPPRARAVARRRPVAPDAAGPGAARPRRRDRAARRRRSWARELGWGDARQALEVETYLATARREFSVPPTAPPERGDDRADAAGVIGPSRGAWHPAAMRSSPTFDAVLRRPRVRPSAAGRRRERRVAGRRSSWSRGGSAGSPRHAAIRTGRRSCRSSWRSACRSATTSRRRCSSATLVEAAPDRRRRRRPRARSARRPSRAPPTARPPRAAPAPSPAPTPTRVRSRRRSPPASSPAPTTSTSVAARPRSSRRRPGAYTCASRTSRSATGRTCTSTSRRTPTTTSTARSRSGKLKATDGAFGYDAAGRHGPGRFRQRDHLVQAVLAPVRRRAVRRRLTRDIDESQGYWQRSDERVPSRLKTPRKGPWPDT